MDPSLAKTLLQLGTYGPLGVMALLGFWLFLLERKKTAELTAKVTEFAKASVAADVEHTKAMEALSSLYDLGVRSTEVNTNVINSLVALKDAVERVEEEVRRGHESKRR